jgi:hypothetical protein
MDFRFRCCYVVRAHLQLCLQPMRDLRSATGLGFGGSSTNLALDQIPICSVFCGIGSPQYRLTLAVDCSPIFVSGVTTSRSSCPIYSDNHHFEMD